MAPQIQFKFSNGGVNRRTSFGEQPSWLGLAQKIEALYKPIDQENTADFDKAFKQLFAPNATIFVNHKSLSVSNFEKQLQTENGATNLVSSTSVSWKDLIEVPLKEGDENGVSVRPSHL